MNDYQHLEHKVVEELYNIAHRIRIKSLKAISDAKYGYPTSCSSIAEILAVLFFYVMKFSRKGYREPYNDRLILSKGHAAPALYAAFTEVGLMKPDMINTLGHANSPVESTPTPNLNLIDFATGSPGMGLSFAAGMAYEGKYIDDDIFRVYCIIGDGETMEGSIWEAIDFCSFYKLDNLCLIMDVNRLGESGETMLGHNVHAYRDRLESFGFNAFVVNGHSIEELGRAFHTAYLTKNKPTCLIAQTFKGRNFPGIEDQPRWHGKILGEINDPIMQHIKKLLRHEGIVNLTHREPPSKEYFRVKITGVRLSSPPTYKIGEEYATRAVYGVALAKLVTNNSRVIAMDCDMKNSTHSEKVLEVSPKNFIECYMAQQNMIGVAMGVASRNRCVVFCSSIGAFLTRAFDQLRMAAISTSNINICGSHAGVSIGEDGPSEMALEDIAMFRSLPGCVILYPSDAVATERAVEIAANTKTLTYIRTSRPPTKVIYPNHQIFTLGKSVVVKSSTEDRALIVTGGVTLVEALKAAEDLQSRIIDPINVRIIDVFTIKPLDKTTIMTEAMECFGRILVVEDHYYEGGIGEAIMSELSMIEDLLIKHLAIKEVPKSGKAEDLLDYYGLNSKGILTVIEKFIHDEEMCPVPSKECTCISDVVEEQEAEEEVQGDEREDVEEEEVDDDEEEDDDEESPDN